MSAEPPPLPPPPPEPPPRPGCRYSLKTLLVLVIGLQLAIALAVVAFLWARRELRLRANEDRVRTALEEIWNAQSEYRWAGAGPYLSLAELSSPDLQLLGDELGSGTRDGYRFDLCVIQRGWSFTCRASPVEPGETGRFHFWLDDTGVVRFARTAAVDADSSEVP